MNNLGNKLKALPRKKRGSTKMHRVHGRHDRKLILLNKLNQPIGPTDEDVTELSSFLGTLARNTTLCPFDILNWRFMDTKKDLWDYTKEKYIIPEAAKDWVLVTIRDAWRRHRKCQFRELLKYWGSEKFKKISETNIKNRKKLMNPHTVGKKSFALDRNKLEKEKEIVSSKEIFVVTRRRKPGHLYKASNENITSKIAEMEEIERQMGTNDLPVDAFSTAMGPEHLGRVRLYGGGVTKTMLKRNAANSEPTINATNDVVQQMQERMQKIEKQMDEQKRTMRREVIADVIAQLQNAGLIDRNVLAAMSVPSLGETTSALVSDQGDEVQEGDESSNEDLT